MKDTNQLDLQVLTEDAPPFAARRLRLGFLAAEARVIAHFLSLFVLVYAFWRLALQWDGTSIIGGSDINLEGVSYLDILRSGGDWRMRPYMPDVLGGAAGHAAFATPVLDEIFARFGVRPSVAYNYSVFILQALFGFFAATSARGVAHLWRPKAGIAREIQWPEGLVISLLTAFAPALAWRIGWSHHTLLYGLAGFAGAMALTLSAAAGTLTLALVLLCYFAIANALSSIGQQILLYAAVFGAPVLLACLALSSRRRKIRALAVLFGVSGASLALVWPRFQAMLEYFTSGASSRGLSSAITYEYLTGTWRDLLASLPWAYLSDAGRENQFLQHEINYAFGPLLLLLLLARWKTAKPALVTFGFVFLLAVALALNLAPISTALLAVVKPLGAFRVPTRAWLVIHWLGLVLALGAWLSRTHARIKSHESTSDLIYVWGTGIALGLVVFMTEPLYAEIFAWAIAAGLAAIAIFQNKPQIRRVLSSSVPEAMLLILLFASVGAFQVRLLPYLKAETLDTDPLRHAQYFREKQPEVQNPLNRTLFLRRHQALAANTGYSIGVSSLDGYWPVSWRFLQLTAALVGREPRRTQINFALNGDHPGLPVLQRLYNLRFQAGSEGPVPIDGAFGPAWFASEIELVPDFATLASDAKSDPERMKHNISLLESDSEQIAFVPQTIYERCREGKVLSAAAFRHGTLIAEVEYESPSECPLVISLNHYPFLTARVGATNLPLFAAYGTLLATFVPAGKGKLVIEAARSAEPEIWAGATSLLLLLVTTSFVWRRRGEEEE